MSECYIYHKESCDGDNCDVYPVVTTRTLPPEVTAVIEVAKVFVDVWRSFVENPKDGAKLENMNACYHLVDALKKVR